MKQVYYQTELISYDALTPAKTLYKEVVLDSSYQRCVGIAVIESGNGGIPFYRIGLDDKDNQFISAVHKNLLVSDVSAGMQLQNRFLPVNIKAGGHKVKVATEIPLALVSMLQYDIVFLLERDEQAQ